MRALRRLVDCTSTLLHSDSFSFAESLALIEWTKKQVLALFPGGGNQFDYIYRRRFMRIIYERYRDIFRN